MAAILNSGFFQNRAGRWFQVNGKFVSEKRFRMEQRRGPGGRFMKKADVFRRADTRTKERLLQERFGGPPLGGGTWISRAERSPDLFAQELADAGFI